MRFGLIRLLVEEFGVRAVGFEAPFDPLHRIDDLVAAGEGNIRHLVAEIDIYHPIKSETMVELFEWLQSFNMSRPPEDRVHVYGFDMTIIEAATNEIGPYLEQVGADVDASLHEDLDTTTSGYGSDDERQALLECARRVHATLEPMFDANESAWVDAISRRAYEHVRHRLHLVDRQIKAHERDYEGRMALRDETMAENVEWIHRRSMSPVIIWGANSHLNRGRHVLAGAGWDVDVQSMGEWLADAYGESYCPVGFELGGGRVSALDGETGDVVDYSIPDPPSASIPDVFRQVGEPLFYVSIDGLYDAPSTRKWLRKRPGRHNIWGGHPDGDSPVHYVPSDLSEFDWVFFVRETSPLVYLDRGQR
ncbi:erythromycin esterase family protein [Salinigranum salinum]|uniref:erythromycin esterase family protein n=1 Tax=Salinigranum salinum TaxID=1364937 RepID=UPI001260D3A5|nr:erythromycin esterase family protein [Salinigranum salinum]